jgi:hypothetical protein
MEMTIKLEIAEDFNLACEIFNITPEAFLQTIVSKISLPYFYSHPNTKKQWATMLFLEYVMLIEKDDEDETNIHGMYLDKMYSVLNNILSEHNDEEKAESCARKVFKEWHRATINKRAEYLIKKIF